MTTPQENRPLVSGTTPGQEQASAPDPSSPVDPTGGLLVSPPAAAHRLSRRTVLVGLGFAGLAGVAGGGIVWWVRSRPLVYRGHSDWVNAAAWSPDGRQIASASNDQTVQVWDAQSGTTRLIYRGHQGWVVWVAWSPDGRAIASAVGEVAVWDTATGHTRWSYQAYTLAGATDVTWAPDGQRLAAAGDWQVQVLEAQNNVRSATYNPGPGWVLEHVAWSPNGKSLAASGAGKEGSALVWDAETGVPVQSYDYRGLFLTKASWSPDSRRLAFGATNGTAQVWDARTGDHLFSYTGHQQGTSVWTIAWSPDGTRIASGGADTTVQIWQPQ